MLNLIAKVTELKHDCGDFRVSLDSIDEKIYDCDDEYDALASIIELFLSCDYDYELTNTYDNGGLTVWQFKVDIDDGDD